MWSSKNIIVNTCNCSWPEQLRALCPFPYGSGPSVEKSFGGNIEVTAVSPYHSESPWSYSPWLGPVADETLTNVTGPCKSFDELLEYRHLLVVSVLVPIPLIPGDYSDATPTPRSHVLLEGRHYGFVRAFHLSVDFWMIGGCRQMLYSWMERDSCQEFWYELQSVVGL